MSQGPILITGASGFVGAHLCQHFMNQGQVVAVQGSARGNWRTEYLGTLPDARNLRTLPLDLTDREAVIATVRKLQPSAIFNCAAYGAYSSQTDADRIYAVNFTAVRTLLEASRELKNFQAFVQAGSSSEYGLNCAAPSENAPTIPDSHYAVSKVAATNLVRFYGIKHALPAWTFRLYSVYGAMEDASRLIPKALMKAQEGTYPPLASPHISRDFVHVDDVCRAFEAVLSKASTLKKGEAYNIGTGTKTTLRDLAQTLQREFKIPQEPPFGSMADRAWDHTDWFSNPTKAAQELGWKARIPLQEGLKQTADWFKVNPEWMKKSIQNTVLAP